MLCLVVLITLLKLVQSFNVHREFPTFLQTQTNANGKETFFGYYLHITRENNNNFT